MADSQPRLGQSDHLTPPPDSSHQGVSDDSDSIFPKMTWVALKSADLWKWAGEADAGEGNKQENSKIPGSDGKPQNPSS